MTRHRLPNRRQSPAIEFEHNRVRYTSQVSYDATGALREMFLNAGKEGTAADIVGRECATILSIALQYNVPLETIENALPKLANGLPAGPVGMALSLHATNRNGE
jgi:hypothetical protein